MTLQEYEKKRDFSRTPEPRPEYSATGARRFVVQEHHASHLHWDFRLEIEGVLKSWAIPKGPPEASGIRRLAIQTEDHPVDYLDFEGEIAEGQYGAGKVVIWDRGTYDLEKFEPREIVVNLRGTRLQGLYVLVNTKDDQWIILKKKT